MRVPIPQVQFRKVKIGSGIDVQELFTLREGHFHSTRVRGELTNRRMVAGGECLRQRRSKLGSPDCAKRMRAIAGAYHRQRDTFCGSCINQPRHHIGWNKRDIACRRYQPIGFLGLGPCESCSNSRQWSSRSSERIRKQRRVNQDCGFASAGDSKSIYSRAQGSRDMANQRHAGQVREGLIGPEPAATAARENEPVKFQSTFLRQATLSRIAQ